MAIIPATIVSSIPAAPVVDQATPVMKTLAVANTAEDLILVPVGKKCRKFTLINNGPGTAFIEADGLATTASVPIQVGDAWVEESVEVSTKFSFIGESGKKPVVRGVIWSGV